jgi:hypothetical protein
VWTGVLLGIVLFSGLLLGFRLLLPSIPFTERPDLVATTPEAGATNVSSRSRVTIAFSAPMNPRSVERAVRIEPPLERSFIWNDDYTTLTISPTQSLRPGTQYLVALDGAARGSLYRPISATAQVTFTTALAPAVVQVTPPDNARDVPVDTPISISFSRSIVPTDTVALPTSLSALRFEPPLEGTAIWMSPSTALFRPAQPLRPGTQYRATLDAAFVDQSGAPLGEPYTWSFATASPQLLSFTPRDGAQAVAPRAPLTLQFSQPIDLPAIQSNLIISPTVTGALTEALLPDATQIVTFTPDAEWQPETTYSVELRGGLMPRSGNLPLQEATRWSFTTAPSPQVVGRFPGADQTLPPGQAIRLIFNTPMDAETLRSAIRFTPPVDQVNVTTSETEAQISTELQAATVYTMTLPPDLADRNGTTIGQEYQFRFQTASAAPALVVPAADGHMLRLDAGADSVVMSRTNLTALDLELYSLDEATVVRTLDFNDADWSSFRPERYNQPRLRAWTASPTNSSDIPVEERVPIVGADGQPLPPGAYYLRVRAPEGPRADLLVLVSQTRLTLQQTGGQALFWATDARNRLPTPGLPVALYRGGALVQQGVTDANGLWQTALPGSESRRPIVAVASGAGIEVMSSTQGVGAVAGTDARNTAFLTTDRTLYAPGETVAVAGFVRTISRTLTLPPLGRQGDLVARRTATAERIVDITPRLRSGGVISESLTLPEDTPPGDYVLAFALDGETFSTRFIVRPVEAPPQQIDIAAPERLTFGAASEARITVGTPEGLPLSGIGISWTLSAQAAELPAFEDYLFGNDERNTDARMIAAGQGQTDVAGAMTVAMTDTLRTSTEPLRYLLTARTTDSANPTVSRRVTFTADPGAVYAGVRLGSRVMRVGETQPIEIVAITPDGAPVADADIGVDIERRSAGNAASNGDPQGFQTEPIATQSLEADDAGQATLPLTPRRGGEYRLRISVTDDAGRQAVTETSLWVAANGFTDWRNTTRRLLLIPDKQTYQPGETARLLVATPFEQASALVTVRRGAALSTSTQTVRSGDILSVTLDVNEPPFVQVNALLLDQDASNTAQTSVDASVALPVQTPDRALDIALSADQTTYAPGSTATLTITTTDAQGQAAPANVIVGLVEARDTSQRPIREALSGSPPPALRTAHLGLTVAPASGLAPVQPAPPPADTTNGLTAYWNADLRTNRDGVLTVTVRLPDAPITFDALVWAAGGVDQFGQARSTIAVIRPLAIALDTPEFVRASDLASAQARIQNTSPTSQTVAVTLNAIGAEVQPGAQMTQQLTIAPGEHAMIVWPIIARESLDIRLRLTATPSSGDPVTVVVERPVLPTSTASVAEEGALVERRLRRQVTIPQAALDGWGSLALDVAADEQALVRRVLEHIQSLPERSVVDDASLILASGVLSGTREINEAALDRIIAAQGSDGGWGWWPRSPSNQFVTALALEALAEGRRAGLDVPGLVVRRGLGALERVTGVDTPLTAQAHAAYVASLYGQSNDEDLQSLVRRMPQLSAEALAYLLLANPPDEMREEALGRLVAGAQSVGERVSWLADTQQPGVSTNTSATALVALALRGDRTSNDLLAGAQRELAAMRGVGAWDSNYASARAVNALLELAPARRANETYTIAVNGAPVIESPTRPISSTQHVTLTLNRLRPNNTLAVTGTVFLGYALQLDEQRIIPDQELSIVREYLDPQTGSPVALDDLRVGQVLRARLTLVANAAQQFVTIDEPIAAGMALVDAGQGQFEHVAPAGRQLTLAMTTLAPGVYEHSYTVRVMSSGEYTTPASVVRLLDGSIIGYGVAAQHVIISQGE